MELFNRLTKCRLCLCGSGNFVHIFNVNVETTYIVADLISALLQFDVSRVDGYPPFVCSACLNKLTEFQIFKDQCIECKETYDHGYLKHENILGDPEILETNHRPINLKEELGIHHITENHHVPVRKELSREKDVEEECSGDRSDARSEICISPVKLEFEENEYQNAELPAVTRQMSDVCESDSGTTNPKETSNSIACGNKSPANVFAQALDAALPTREDNPSSSEFPVCSLRSVRRRKWERELNIDEQQQNTERKADEEKEGEKGLRVYKCHHCGQESSSKMTLNKHLKMHGKERPFMCSTCGKMFLQKHHIAQHQKTHENKDFECKKCGKKFHRRFDLMRHLMVHGRRSMFQCTSCDKGFYRKYQLEGHQSTHDGEKTWECKVCKKEFEKFKDFFQHCRSHLLKKKLICDICGCKFAKKSSLRSHVMRHMEVKPHECGICERRFLRPDALNRHMKVHTGEGMFSCDVCGKSYTQKENLVIHNRIHTGERPYSCKFCDKAFKSNVELFRHMPSHSKEKTFSCDLCPKMFSFKTNVSRHRKKTHSKDSSYI